MRTVGDCPEGGRGARSHSKVFAHVRRDSLDRTRALSRTPRPNFHFQIRQKQCQQWHKRETSAPGILKLKQSCSLIRRLLPSRLPLIRGGPTNTRQYHQPLSFPGPRYGFYNSITFRNNIFMILLSLGWPQLSKDYPNACNCPPKGEGGRNRL